FDVIADPLRETCFVESMGFARRSRVLRRRHRHVIDAITRRFAVATHGRYDRQRMTISFDLPPELAELRTKVRAFVDTHVIPNEAKILEEDKVKNRDTLREL